MAKKSKDQVVELDPQAEAEARALAEANAARVSELKTQEADLEVRLKEVKAELRALSPSAASRRGPVGVGAFIKEQIAEGKTNAEILELVTQNFPANNTNVNCINWYRNAVKNWPDGKRPSKKAAAVTESSADEGASEESGEFEEAA